MASKKYQTAGLIQIDNTRVDTGWHPSVKQMSPIQQIRWSGNVKEQQLKDERKKLFKQFGLDVASITPIAGSVADAVSLEQRIAKILKKKGIDVSQAKDITNFLIENTDNALDYGDMLQSMIGGIDKEDLKILGMNLLGVMDGVGWIGDAAEIGYDLNQIKNKNNEIQEKLHIKEK